LSNGRGETVENAFNPYREWLGLELTGAEPNHYELLKLDLFESDGEAIRIAAENAMSRVRSFRPGGHASHWAKLLDTIESVKECLTDPAKKAQYDADIQTRPEEVTPPSPVTGASTTPSASSPTSTVEVPGDSAPAAVNPMYPPGMGKNAPGATPAAEQPSASTTESPQQPAPGESAPDSQPAWNRPQPRPAEAAMPASGGVVQSPVAMPPSPAASPQADLNSQSAAPMAFPHAPTPDGPAAPMAMPVQGGGVPGGAPAATPQQGGPMPATPTDASYAMPPTQAAGMTATPAMGATAAPTPAAPPGGNPMEPVSPFSSVESGVLPLTPSQLEAQTQGPPVPTPGAPAATAPVPIPVEPVPPAQPEAEAETKTKTSLRDVPRSQWLAIVGLAAAVLLLTAAIVMFVAGKMGKEDAVADVDTAGETDAGDPETDPTTDPADPADDPKTDPDKDPKTDPGDDPKTNPGDDPKTDPGDDPKTDPGDDPKTDPDDEPIPAPPVRPDPPVDPKTDPPVDPKPTGPPTKEDLIVLGQAMTRTRLALEQRQLDVAAAELAKAETMARLPEHKAKVRRLKDLTHYVGQFWDAVDKGLSGLDSGHEIVAGDTRAIVVEVRPDVLILKKAGRSRHYPLDDLDPGLAVALADRWLDKSALSTKVIKGAFYAVEPKAPKSTARRLWQEAMLAGSDVGDLLPVLDDRYNFATGGD